MEDYVVICDDLLNDKKLLLESDVCGCFHCLSIFNPNQISEWVPYTEGIAICPYCGIDSIVGDSQGTLITKDYLKELRHRWF